MTCMDGCVERPCQVMSEWGTAMRQWYGKRDASAARGSDITLQYLGYTTGEGSPRRSAGFEGLCGGAGEKGRDKWRLGDGQRWK